MIIYNFKRISTSTTFYSIFFYVFSLIKTFPKTYIQKNCVQELQKAISTGDLKPPESTSHSLNAAFTFESKYKFLNYKLKMYLICYI